MVLKFLTLKLLQNTKNTEYDLNYTGIQFMLPCIPRTVFMGAKLFIGTPECVTKWPSNIYLV